MNLNNMKKLKFGDRINFDEIFYDVLYITNKEYYDTKLYDISINPDSLNITKPYKDGLLHEKVKKYPAGYRKLVFTKESGNGIIVGQTMKREGYYWPGYGPSAPNWDDSEPPVFDAKKTYTFWIVATKMNEKVLVPKTTI